MSALQELWYVDIPDGEQGREPWLGQGYKRQWFAAEDDAVAYLVSVIKDGTSDTATIRRIVSKDRVDA